MERQFQGWLTGNGRCRTVGARKRLQWRNARAAVASRSLGFTIPVYYGRIRQPNWSRRCWLPNEGVRQISGLCPDDDPFIIKAEVDAIRQSVLLVSHLPFLSRLAGLMTTGESQRPAIEFAPATLVCLSRQAYRWKFNWSVRAASS